MPKDKTVFVCSGCGYESTKWLGKCPGCNEWNSFYEEKVSKKMSVGATSGRPRAYTVRPYKFKRNSI